jgi:hypothetical protein|eukprot:CAMPEP_0174310098 /NCGR_PEP_ID=MMETSP0810-20121108/2835_1 /TAXON_ID=73025 ORGANISM="Eutreptiella gymnastica-like, Strain CCMP1594" /NCGR_SAMPLE_ID=MMETSP0810 /ASSEMBLY_ACC=CAM_ASM_000659 /LENGTH=60 /DNA_ID=CAMNT_0015417921 /DNA_START=380 /DNA_END=562 /DNA_ORIENTATION=+
MENVAAEEGLPESWPATSALSVPPAANGRLVVAHACSPQHGNDAKYGDQGLAPGLPGTKT